MESRGVTRRGELQLVVFKLGNETYGVDIVTVREIIALQPITRVPGAPTFVEGILNLRGHVIPVMDLRRRFGLPWTQATRDTRIMVVEVAGRTLGLVVDAVSEVLRVPAETLEPPHELTVGVDVEFLQGVAKLDQRLVILLDLEQLLQAKERQPLKPLKTGNTSESEVPAPPAG
ncbi:chemotaxis protein CheW [Carboxydochorda subterranea]|uniref:Chemotaxis protein CheW n=1 Tax=Carboxydichorda subterranea TaxID=3109565 RepID=A0ABZ1BX98_9FIRM|nr:chemotaxis protein CheW [Limnochorda sp. L945t]WRP17412.1 chemotaxis protein CheW [Limnochorda sp. L945t]